MESRCLPVTKTSVGWSPPWQNLISRLGTHLTEAELDGYLRHRAELIVPGAGQVLMLIRTILHRSRNGLVGMYTILTLPRLWGTVTEY